VINNGYGSEASPSGQLGLEREAVRSKTPLLVGVTQKTRKGVSWASFRKIVPSEYKN